MYTCKITSVWVGNVETFNVKITYLGREFDLGPFDSMVDAGNAATEFYIENYNEANVACIDDNL